MKNKILILITLALILFNLAKVNAVVISSVESTPNEIAPGEISRISLTIENNLNDDIENVQVSLDLTNLPFAPYQSSNQINFEKIKESASKDAEFELISFANAELGTYKIPVKISYTLNNEQKTESGLISLIVNAKPIIDVSSDSSFVIKGKENNLNIKIVNSGLGEIKFLNVKLNADTGFRITSSDSSYIGSVAGDDFDTAQFIIIVNENSPSTINLNLQLNYRDSRNKEITENKNIALRAYTIQEAQDLGLVARNNTSLYISVVIALIVLYIIYRIIKNRRKRKMREKAQL